MKNFTLNVIMTLFMMMGVALNVNAFTPYTDLKEAQDALDELRLSAKDVAASGTMDAEVYKNLKAAIDNGDGVMDSARRNDIYEVNNAIETLEKAIIEAKESIEQYKPLDDAIDAFNDFAANEFEEKMYEEIASGEITDEQQLQNLFDAQEAYKTEVADALSELKRKATPEMLADVANGNVDIRQLLKNAGIALRTVEEVIKAATTGISSIVVDSAENVPAYGLDGAKVSERYKGVIIKGGKKYMVK